jgi:short subunit dehydrogenase-like uncharacterized protein
MSSSFLLYGATGFIGSAIARRAVEHGMQPILAGRNADQVGKLAAELGLEHRVFDLLEPQKIEQALDGVVVVLNCAGPFIHTSIPIITACLQTGTHYLDLTGEIPVYEAVFARDAQAQSRGVMLLPGAGFDVMPTDCLAAHLKRRLPSATHLTLAFQFVGPAGFPPGTQRTGLEVVIPFGTRVRRDGRLEIPDREPGTLRVDFGSGPVQAMLYPWCDVFTAYYSTGIPNIADYMVMTDAMRTQFVVLNFLRPLFKFAFLRKMMNVGISPGPTLDQCARTVSHIWGQVEDDQGHKVASRLHGPEGGVVWTSRATLAAVDRVLSGEAPVGYQTPAKAFGPDFVLECEGVTRKDLE